MPSICYSLYSAEAMSLGFDKLTKANLASFADVMGMPEFKKEDKKDFIAKIIEKHLIWAFDNAEDYYY